MCIFYRIYWKKLKDIYLSSHNDIETSYVYNFVIITSFAYALSLWKGNEVNKEVQHHKQLILQTNKNSGN